MTLLPGNIPVYNQTITRTIPHSLKMMDMRNNSFATEKQHQIHRSYVIAYHRVLAHRLEETSKRNAPPNTNFIDPASLAYMHVDDVVPNFKGYTALRKFGMPFIANRDVMGEWKNELHPTVTADDLIDYLTEKDIRLDTGWFEIEKLLLEDDYC